MDTDRAKAVVNRIEGGEGEFRIRETDGREGIKELVREAMEAAKRADMLSTPREIVEIRRDYNKDTLKKGHTI